jgi:hypothetical protein
MSVPLSETDQRLKEALVALAADYGEMGVFDTAAQLWPDAAAAHRAQTMVSAAGGWYAPVRLPLLSVRRGGIVHPTPEEVAAAEAKRTQWLHDTRWKRRRNLAKAWLLLRPLRHRLHDHIHRNCDEEY